MAKKRKTRKDKVILSLKRELAKEERPKVYLSKGKKENKFTEISLPLGAIKKDLVKSFLLSTFAIVCLFLLYLA
ncbi:MAG: hypothetical protein ABIB61_03315 [Candidatus Shapirobacteria bacterium]